MKPVIAILPRVALPAIAGSENDIRHLAGGDKVQNILCVGCVLKEIREKFLHGCAEHGGLLRGIHAMAMQFHEKPVGAAVNRDGGALPKRKAADVWRRGVGEAAILNASFSAAD